MSFARLVRYMGGKPASQAAHHTTILVPGSLLLLILTEWSTSPLASVYLSAATLALVYWAYRHGTRRSREDDGTRI